MQEERPRLRGVRVLSQRPLLVGVVLDHALPVKAALVVSQANAAGVLLDAVPGTVEDDGGGEEGVFVAFAGGALGEDGVVVRWAVDVVVGC